MSEEGERKKDKVRRNRGDRENRVGRGRGSKKYERAWSPKAQKAQPKPPAPPTQQTHDLFFFFFTTTATTYFALRRPPHIDNGNAGRSGTYLRT